MLNACYYKSSACEKLGLQGYTSAAFGPLNLYLLINTNPNYKSVLGLYAVQGYTSAAFGPLNLSLLINTDHKSRKLKV